MGAQGGGEASAAAALGRQIAGMLDPLPGPLTVPERSRMQTAPLAAPPAGAAGPTPAAVMVILLAASGAQGGNDAESLRSLAADMRVILTVRRAELRRHAGEVALPGGRQDPRDAHLLETALRESEEELGLARSRLLPVGALAPARTIATNYLVSPFVSLLAESPASAPARSASPPSADVQTDACEHAQIATLGLRPSPAEVAQVLTPTLAQIASGGGEHQLTRRGITFRTPVFAVGEHVIWGLTYRVLSDLLERLSLGAPAPAHLREPGA